MRRTISIGCVVALLALSATALAQPNPQAQSIALTEQAAKLITAGKFREAAPLLEKAIDLDPDNMAAYLHVSKAYWMLDRSAEAVPLLEQAEQHTGFDSALVAARGAHLFKLKRLAEARTALERAFGANPNDYDAAFYLGETYLKLGAWDKVAMPMRAYLSKRPASRQKGDRTVRHDLAYGLLHARVYGEAERELRALRKEFPMDGEIALMLGEVLSATSRCPEALQIYDVLLKQNAPNAVEIHYQTAVCQFQMNKYQPAMVSLEKVEQMRPGEPKVPDLRGRIYAALNRNLDAIKELTKALQMGRPVEAALGDVLFRTNQYQQAHDTLQPLVGKPGTRPAVLELAARAALKIRNAADAKAAAAAYVLVAGAKASSHVYLGRAHLLAQEYVDAQSACERALALTPSHKDAASCLRSALELQADRAFQAKNLDAALALLKRANEVEPGVRAVVQNLGLLAIVKGDNALAVKVLQPFVDKNPKEIAAVRLLGHALAVQGDKKTAGQLLGRVIREAGDKAALRDLKIEALVEQSSLLVADDFAQAQDLMQQAVKLAKQTQRPDLKADVDKRAAIMDVLAAEAALAAGQEAAAGKLLNAARASKQLAADWDVRARIDLAFSAGYGGNYEAGLKALAGVTVPAGPITKDTKDIAALYLVYVSGARSAKRSLTDLPALARKKPASEDMQRKYHDLLVAAYDKLIFEAAERGDAASVKRLSAEAPGGGTIELKHNTIVASWNPGNAGVMSQLEQLAPQVPEAYVNLAIAASGRGDRAAVIRYLTKARGAGAGGKDVADWLAWEQKFQ